ncbi:hypothetical protein HY639_05095 [Candidatus Woesearchaeota archaeon]|nr:hypothetical protein [Candidatus Woesearchaeota archaeon]
MDLTITSGLQEIINFYCKRTPAKLFYQSEHRGGLVAVQYKAGYLSNMTVPNSLLERAMSPGRELGYLHNNPDLILIPYLQGTSQGFRDQASFYIGEMGQEFPQFPMLLLITGTEFKAFDTKTEQEVPLCVVETMPPYMGDKITQFFEFLGQK